MKRYLNFKFIVCLILVTVILVKFLSQWQECSDGYRKIFWVCMQIEYFLRCTSPYSSKFHLYFIIDWIFREIYARFLILLQTFCSKSRSSRLWTFRKYFVQKYVFYKKITQITCAIKNPIFWKINFASFSSSYI